MGYKHFVLIVLAVSIWPIDSFAYTPSRRLFWPPPSFVVPTRDRKSVLVMLSPVPLSKDEGNTCTLPNGKSIKLRDTFCCSGLYDVGSTTPIWTVKWYGEKRCVTISEDGRYLVRINPLWGGLGGCQEDMDWGIKFYDTGTEVKSYDVTELVDYPSLMDYDPRWMDWKLCDDEICVGRYHLGTICRERYTFDVATGGIVEESRYWRRVAHWTCALLGIVAVLGVWLVYRNRKSHRLAAAKTPVSEVEPVPSDGEAKPFQYSLRSLMLLVTLAAVLCSAFSIGAHVGVFVSSVVLAVFLTAILWRRQRRSRLQRGTSRSNRGRKRLWAAVLVSWFVVYVLSMGPVAAVMSPQCLDCRRDTQVVILHGVYAPAYEIYRLRNEPLRLYFSAFAPDVFSGETGLMM
jgi:hypothetical protein